MNRKITLFTVFVCSFLTVGAQQTLDLPECRKLALDHNKDLKIAKENKLLCRYPHSNDSM